MMNKRGREDGNGSSIEDSSMEQVANCLIQISNGPLWGVRETKTSNNKTVVVAERMFECKTCGRSFNSFQALGGHRASHHKKPKVVLLSTHEEKMESSEVVVAKVKVKTVHECSICGTKFPLGQALGGHMRRHRVDQPKGAVVDDHKAKALWRDDHEDVAKLVPVLMRSLSKNRRVMCMDLNLTPLENDLQVLFGKKAPKVDCKLVL